MEKTWEGGRGVWRREVAIPPFASLATWKLAGPQGLRNNRLEGFGQGLLILPDNFLSCFGDRKKVKILMFFFFQLPALLRPPEPLPTLEVLLQGLGLLLGGSLMLTIALLEEQLQPLVSDG